MVVIASTHQQVVAPAARHAIAAQGISAHSTKGISASPTATTAQTRLAAGKSRGQPAPTGFAAAASTQSRCPP